MFINKFDIETKNSNKIAQINSQVKKYKLK